MMHIEISFLLTPTVSKEWNYYIAYDAEIQIHIALGMLFK